MRGIIRIRGILLAGALTVAAVVFTPAPAFAESNGGVRVMPLGASITDGHNVPGGYRIGLWQRFGSGGHTVDFVGSGYNGPAQLSDHDHEGHSGWRIDQIDAQVVWWLRTTNLHAVLLHAGTNDMLQNYDVANAPSRLATLVDHILATAPGAEVFVAQLVRVTDPTVESRVQAFNAAMPGALSGKGPRVHVVDMHSPLTTADLADGVHPTADGYDKMAAVWYSAMQAVPASLSPPGPPLDTPLNVINPQAWRCLDVNGASAAPAATTLIWDCHGAANQKWTRTAAGELRVYGGSCLDVKFGVSANGTEVIIWPCHGGANQKWSFQPNGTIRSQGTGRCLDVTGNASANGTKISIYDCNDTNAQQWAAQP